VRVSCAVLMLVLLSCANRAPVLSIHLADYEEAPGRIRIAMPSGEAPLYAESSPVLDERDFSSVSVSHDDFGRTILNLCFAPDGRRRFVKLARHNTNRSIVFLVRGKLLFAPVITSDPIPQCATVQGAVSPADAEALQRVIR
jgi:preprotein translocase subunit SecD